MEKESFLDVLKKIEWPNSSKVVDNFLVVLFFLISLIIIFAVIDETLGTLITKIMLG